MDSPITTGISIAMGNSVINKIRVDIKLNKFSPFETLNDSVNHKTWDEIPERQEYPLLVPLIKQQSYLSQFLFSLGYAENPVLRLVSILEKEEKKEVSKATIGALYMWSPAFHILTSAL